LLLCVGLEFEPCSKLRILSDYMEFTHKTSDNRGCGNIGGSVFSVKPKTIEILKWVLALSFSLFNVHYSFAGMGGSGQVSDQQTQSAQDQTAAQQAAAANAPRSAPSVKQAADTGQKQQNSGQMINMLIGGALTVYGISQIATGEASMPTNVPLIMMGIMMLGMGMQAKGQGKHHGGTAAATGNTGSQVAANTGRSNSDTAKTFAGDGLKGSKAEKDLAEI
jgi:hypothetical protein